ncbi:MAG: hypothetical protein JRN15_24450 [Nitrososphaerota archaeon]|nr:hypothetical protein [Nitrososphaerota archaeon]
MAFDPLFNTPPRNTTKPVKIRFEFNDESGAKYALNIEGMSKDNISKVMDFVQTMSSNTTPNHEQIDTNFSKLYDLITKNFRFGSFTSTDVLEAYQDNSPTPTSLSVISTYLTRLAKRGLLVRVRHGSGWIYKLPRIEQPLSQEPLKYPPTSQTLETPP